MKKIILFVIVLLSTALSSAQDFNGLSSTKNFQSDLGLSEIKLGENLWDEVISRNEVGLTYCALLSKNGLGIGPDTQEIMEEVRDAEFRTDPSVQKWMQPSLRAQPGRIRDSYWRHDISVGGPPTSSGNIGIGVGNTSFDLETGSSEKTVSLKITYLPTMESKTFQWTAKYSSTNLEGLSYQRAFSDFFRNSGLPSFSYDRWDNDPRIRRGLVAVGKVWEKVDQGIAHEVIPWMKEISAK